MSDIRQGDVVDVVSGPHEGRSGPVIQLRDISTGGDPETYAVVAFRETDCFNETHADTISVPVRRLRRR